MTQRCASDIPQARRYEIGDVDIAGLGETLNRADASRRDAQCYPFCT
jgi:hypothetical protein